MLVTTPAKKSVQSRLQEKGKYRKKGGASGILGMYPAGTGELGVIKSRDEFLEGREGDELWYKHVEENTSGFSEAHRATSTAFEHDMYMRSISEWVVLMGFAPLVERALAPGPNVFEGLQIVQVDGRPNVMKAEMIVAMLSLMSVGDARAPKNLALVRKIKEREAEAPIERPSAKRAKESTSLPSKVAECLGVSDGGGGVSDGGGGVFFRMLGSAVEFGKTSSLRQTRLELPMATASAVAAAPTVGASGSSSQRPRRANVKGYAEGAYKNAEAEDPEGEEDVSSMEIVEVLATEVHHDDAEALVVAGTGNS